MLLNSKTQENITLKLILSNDYNNFQSQESDIILKYLNLGIGARLKMITVDS
jgi:hypothetical protein